MKVLTADISHIERLCEISRESLREAFTEGNFKSSFNNPLEEVLICQEENGEILGYCDFTFVAGEGELLSIGVSPLHRKKGVARLLFSAMVNILKNRNVSSLFLEVRENNKGARALYQGFGMNMVGRRPGFYNDPMEDALIYRLDL